MAQVSLDMYQTLAIAVVALLIGAWLKTKIKVLDRLCIPSPVVGGLLFSIITCVLYAASIVDFKWDDTLKNVCMVIFFTSVGFQANVKVLKSGGKALIVLLFCVLFLIEAQDVIAVAVSNVIGVDPLIGLATGSISMVGGHGTAGAFGPVLEDMGVTGATTVATAAATFGLVAGSLIGAMIVAAIMRNIGEYTGKIDIRIGEINDLGGICLSLFLGIAMITLKLWQLADLALPMIILLACQFVFMVLYARFVIFNAMGRDYDAAVLTAGSCGFGMGATPNAMANMQVLTDKYGPSVKAFLLIPLIGSMFADFMNSLSITLFINLI